MLKNTFPYSNNRHVSHTHQLPHILKINLHTRLDDGKDPKSEINDKTKNKLKDKNELEKDLNCKIDDKTKDELKEKIKNELKKDLKFEIGDKTKDELKEKIKNELEKDLNCKIDNKTKDELKEKIKNELKKDLKFEIGDKTKDELKEKIKNELEKDLNCKIDDKTKDELKEKIKNELKKDLKFEIGDKTKDELKEKIKNELEKDLNCKIDDKTKDELKKNIKNELKKDLNCKIDDKTKDELKEKIKNELKKDLKFEIDDNTKGELIKEVEEKIDKELRVKLNCDIFKMCGLEEKTKEIIDDGECNRKGCENSKKDGNHIDVSNDGKLYIRKAINKLYPDLSEGIIDKIKANDYYVKQFGITATDCNKNGTEYPFITWRGTMDARCVTIPANSTCKESYDIRQVGNKDNLPDWYASCKNNMFSDNSHLVNTKAYYYPNSIDKNKPVVVLSQSESLIIADKKTDRLVRKDGTVSDKTIDECKEFFDSDKRTSFAEEKGDCEVCKEVIWDSSEVVPVFFI
ncbi:hypothetical protein [Wolbachia endosymbiont (group B) of Pandemis cinnamomeana]|uniref:hypothetical protein n=1 Tax=Wolbachia endosymbiont (group B) of Pandemis cinnamomeana TaxID=2954038 RepID=UPI00248AD9E9|nr:hypothetical protein [Wolbachia endosymbiont (group B) of Pandemis cinnamomeana]